MTFTVVVLLGFAAFAAASPTWGPVADTPEVAAAKAAHFAAVARTAGPQPGAWNGAPAHGGWNGAPAQGAWNGAPAQGAWNGAQASGWNAPEDDGQWHDDSHLYDNGNNAGQWNVNNGQWAGHNAGQWAGNNNGQWNGAQEDDGQWRDDTHLYDNGNNVGQWAGQNAGQWNGQNAGQWNGHNAGQWAQQNLVNGETPEVAAARAAHLAAHNAISAHRYKRSVYGYGVAHLSPVVAYHTAAVAAPVSHTSVVHTSVVHPVPLALGHGFW